MSPTTVAQLASDIDGPRSPSFLFPGFAVYPGMPSLSLYLHAKQFGLPTLPTGIPLMGLPWRISMPSSANPSPTNNYIIELAEKRIGDLVVKLRSEETRGETLLQLSKYKDNAHLSSIIWSTFGTRFRYSENHSLLILLIGTMAILINEVVHGYSLLPNMTEKESERICNTLHVLKKAASTVEGRKGFLQGELGATTCFAST